MEVRIIGVSKAFGALQALEPVTLTVPSGQFTTLLGPSGCGKTTLLRMIAGLETPDSGEIYFGDELIASIPGKVDKPVHKRRLGMVFQDFALWPHMTVFENVAYGLRAAGSKDQLHERVLEAIEMVQLQGLEKRHPGQLSGGQQQRVAFARAVVIRPQIILFDEPLSALDAVLREELRVELMSLVRVLGLTALYVTHDQTEAMSMSDQIVVMRQGRILQAGAPEAIYRKPADSAVAQFIGKSNWIVEGTEMFRPEHLKWSGDSSHRMWEVLVKAASYVGDRYEVLVETDTGNHWFGYAHERLAVGSRIKVFVETKNIQCMESREAIIV